MRRPLIHFKPAYSILNIILLAIPKKTPREVDLGLGVGKPGAQLRLVRLFRYLGVAAANRQGEGSCIITCMFHNKLKISQIYIDFIHVHDT